MYLCSDSIMALINNIIGSLYIADKDVPILYFNAKFSFKCFMNLNGGFHVKIPCFISPVGVERKWHSLRS